ncbi:MAG: EAL domain-containing protein [Gammaproteobacteria bacterium]|nr:EAL domain-containing protein [Gammaproteobacteria bacterium]
MASDGHCPNTPPVVLVVDDDISARHIIRSHLEPKGYVVHDAGDGLEALSIAEKTRPEIILLDIMMPNMDGFDACEHLRQLPYAKHIPIVMMTGLDDTESIATAYDMGATDFITKPINYPLLSYRMDYVLRAKRTADNLIRSEARLSKAQRIARIGHWEWDVDANLIHHSNGIGDIFGITDLDPFVNVENFLAQLHADDRESASLAIERGKKEGKNYGIPLRILVEPDQVRNIYQEAEFTTAENGDVTSAICTIQDVTEQKHSEETIRYLSNYDALTGLPNRALFAENLRRNIAKSQRHDRAVAILVIGLDNFRRINDTLGYRASDQILIVVAHRLLASIRSADMVSREGAADNNSEFVAEIREDVARLAGDEFVIMLPEIHRAEDTIFVAKRIVKSFKEPFVVEGHEVYVSVSVGVSAYPVDGGTAETLLKRAHVAMNHAKQEPGSQFQFYHQSLDKSARRKLSMETQLRKAIENEQFEVYYQPRVNIQLNRLMGMEALIRWQHPDHGLLSPNEFIPLAEETGVILPLGEWVLGTACTQAAELHELGLPHLTVSVNMSAAQFRQKNPVSRITDVIAATAVDPSCVELELTEGILLEDIHTGLDTLSALKQFGLKIAVDDFGTGYSSLSYLKRLPVTALKIDQSFVQGIDHDKSDAAITEAIISLAHSLHLQLIAEGIERQDQLAFLKARGCDEGQGYFICPPLTHSAFCDWASAATNRTRRFPSTMRFADTRR